MNAEERIVAMQKARYPNTRVAATAAKLAEEGVEVCQAVIDHIDANRDAHNTLRYDEVLAASDHAVEELGDTLGLIVVLADLYGTSIAGLLEREARKLDEKWPVQAAMLDAAIGGGAA